MIQLIRRDAPDVKHEMIGFRCTAEQAARLRELAKEYNTTITDIILQLISNAIERKSNE